tara:strand:+ start:1621 stop:2196 length:576 start_codon:yes stop_codon:yes gene_type:complete
MKKVIQSILFLFLIIISIIFYKTYFGEEKKQIVKIDESEDQSKVNFENNLIKNLKYDVIIDQNNQYIITADLSEITYQNGIEVVNMRKVVAMFIDKTNIPLTITSDQAIYNNSNHNTKFSQKVRIEYLDNIILSDKMDLNFNNKIIMIYENVEYDGIQGAITADNVKIDLITKKIEIYMDNANSNVEVTTK